MVRESEDEMSTHRLHHLVDAWFGGLTDLSLSETLSVPDACAIFSADMINGFLREGPLASDRVDSIAQPVVSLMQRSWELGVRDIVLLQDTHEHATPEFKSYPPHAIAGTSESQTIPEIASLRFARRMVVIEKNSLNPALGTIFDSWLAEHDYIRTAIVVGNCTDLCVYQLAMHLRLHANALNISEFDVVIPENCVATYDTPEHPADELHQLFLHHMVSNGIRVVRSLS